MARMVNCKKYGKELPGLLLPPYPGPKGKEIFETVSQQAWTEWLSHQTMLINEKQLSMAMGKDRQYLQAEMDKFLSNQSFDTADGYVPEDKD